MLMSYKNGKRDNNLLYFLMITIFKQTKKLFS